VNERIEALKNLYALAVDRCQELGIEPQNAGTLQTVELMIAELEAAAKALTSERIDALKLVCLMAADFAKDYVNACALADAGSMAGGKAMQQEALTLACATVHEAEQAAGSPLKAIADAVQLIRDRAPGIEPLLALSTGHVSKATNAWLMNAAGSPGHPVHVTLRDHGFLIAVPDPATEFWEFLVADYAGGKVPDDLYECLNYAAERSCSWLLLDADASDVADLPTHEW
jgi:hypothetical protein